MTQLIIDESTSQTPIGQLLEESSSDAIELRSGSGELLGTLIFPTRTNDERETELLRQLEADADIINERLARPITEGLTKDEFLERLRQL